jgi:hypothetical protein
VEVFENVNGTPRTSVARLLIDVSGPNNTPFDFDGDGKTDIGIFRPSGGEWWINRSGNGQTFALQFGSSTDVIAPADYTGDGKADIAFFRPSSGEWYVLKKRRLFILRTAVRNKRRRSCSSRLRCGWKGRLRCVQTIELELVHLAVKRSTDSDIPIRYQRRSTRRCGLRRRRKKPTSEYSVRPPAALSGGSKDRRPARWQCSSERTPTKQFKAITPATENLTSRSGVRRRAKWLIVRSEDFSFYGFPFGMNGDVVAPGDYDGDGKFDATVFRPSSATWFISRTTAGTQIVQFGANGDRPLPNAFVP